MKKGIVFGLMALFALGCELPNVVDKNASVTKSTCAPPGSGTLTPPTTEPPVTPPAPPAPSNPASTALEQPTISPSNGTYAYNTEIKITANNLPKNAVIEVSLDGGKTFGAANILLLNCSAQVSARVRLDQNVSTTAYANYKVFFKRVAFIGNSITHHAPNPDLGWKGDWGMAASAADKDYKSVLMSYLKQRNPQIESFFFRAVPFEQNYWTYDYAEIDKVLAFQPDLIILRIGENIDESQVNNRNFFSFYLGFVQKLVDYKKARIIVTNSFWRQDYGNGVIRDVSNGLKLELVRIDDLYLDPTNTARGLFAHEGVANHPGDKGMKTIADRIWKVLE